MPQVKPEEHPEEDVPADEPAAEEALANDDTRRSTSSLSQCGQVTPSAPAPIRCRREKTFPQLLQRYS